VALGVAAAGIAGVGLVVSALGASAAEGTVTKVVDGDTVDVSVGGEVVRVRLLNVDAPESVNPNAPVECLGPEAATRLKSLLPVGASVELRFDAERHDRYGRTLAAVYRDGRMVNAELARAGLAMPVTYGSNSKFRAQVDAAYTSAERTEVGMFAPSMSCTLPGQAAALEQQAEELQDAAALASPEQAEAAGSQATALIGAALALEGVVHAQATFASRALTTSARGALLAVTAGIRETATVRREAAAARAASIRAERAAAAKARAEAAARARAAARAKAAAARAKAAAAAKARADAAARAEAEAAARRQAAATPRTRAGSSSSSSGSSGSVDLSGYTGCRRYAPGGKTWTPIPCP
jgi:micrococcal nuclease